MTQQQFYTLTPLSGDVGKQEVQGFALAMQIAREIAARGHDVIVRNEREMLDWMVEAEVVPEEFQRFEDLARKLVQVPKAEIDSQR